MSRYNEAYAEGFRKAAEAAGISHVTAAVLAMRKQAAMPSQVGKALDLVRRYVTLLRGGDKAIVGGYNDATKALKELSNSETLSPFKRKLAGVLLRSIVNTRRGHYSPPVRFNAGEGNMRFDPETVATPEVIRELDKAMYARLATAGGVAGLGIGINNAIQQSRRPWYQKLV